MQIIDGKKIAQEIRTEISDEIKKIYNKDQKVPGLAIIVVGDDPASKVYVSSKIKSCSAVGIKSFDHTLPNDVTEDEVLNIIEELNNNDEVDGILVQLPLPKHIDPQKIVEKISLEKDVDGFKPQNLGLLLLNNSTSLRPCTPAGIMELLTRYDIDIQGKDVTIIGRSNIVGKPMAAYIINAGGTLTICNSHTKDIKYKTSNADILIVSMGSPKFIKKDMVKDGAVIIDVGINRTENGLCGDVDHDDVKDKVSYITPVPGGVGPMTVAMLLKNTLQAFKKNKAIDK